VSWLAEKIPRWFGSAVTRYLAPEIMRIVDERVTRSENALKELMNARFKAIEDTMNVRFKAVEDTMNTRFKAVEDTMNGRFGTLDAKIDGLEKRLDLVQRVALLEAKVRDIETKH
jgi:hypothetical protein